HLHTTRHMVFLVGPACDFLARRDRVAKSATPFANGRWVLCNIVVALHLRRPGWNAKTGRAIRISATGACHSGFKFPGSSWLFCPAFHSIRFRQWHQSIARTPLLRFGSLNERRFGSLCPLVCLWTCAPLSQSWCRAAVVACSDNYRYACHCVGDHCEPCCIRERTQLVSFMTVSMKERTRS